MKVEILGTEALRNKFKNMSAASFQKVCRKQVRDMFNNSRTMTPVKSGQLRLSVTIGENEMGYTKDYAPHVEYGHRVVINHKVRGYVPGQYYLKKIVEKQRPVFRDDILKEIMKHV